ncbi:MAG: aspartate aminotransferase family protein [Trueperaceae bacterium]|nr:MAG: aspartate aminotransferase family protein [Trueperaceae bacterium]
MTPEEFRRLGYRLIDRIADYRSHVGEYPVMSQLEPGDVRKRLPAAPPEQGHDLSKLIDEIDAILGPGLTHFQHPRFFGYFPANAELSSVLGDLLSSGLGQLGINWQASPALTEVEEHMTDWMRQLIGLPESFQGVIQDTASTSNLLALICARERVTAHGQEGGGLQVEEVPLTVYTSEQSHSSIEKAALLAGFGRDNVRSIATDEAYALRVEALEQAIEDDLAAGRKPCALVATVGTTATTALDPVGEMARLAERFGLWLHVDGALAGSAMILPECRWMWRGIERVDSLVLNPHKWLGAVFDCSLFYVGDAPHLVRVMSTDPSYLKTSVDAEAKNYRDWGIPLGRRFRALKLWFLLYSEGAEGLRARLRRDIANAQWLKEQVDAAPGWERLTPVPLQTVCVRHVLPGLTSEELDAHTLDWAHRINASGEAYLTPAKLDGRWMVRVSIGSLLTEREDVAALWELMKKVVSS